MLSITMLVFILENPQENRTLLNRTSTVSITFGYYLYVSVVHPLYPLYEAPRSTVYDSDTTYTHCVHILPSNATCIYKQVFDQYIYLFQNLLHTPPCLNTLFIAYMAITSM